MVLSRRVFAMRGVLLVMKTLEDERYVVIKAYKCTVSEICRDFFCIGMYCVYVVSLHIDSTESMINKVNQRDNLMWSPYLYSSLLGFFLFPS